MRPLPRKTRAKRKRTTSPSSSHRKPKVGDFVDVYWDDRNVYYRGKLVKRWPTVPFGFYIRYEDGDYISTNLDHFSWHFALPGADMWRQCCARATDFYPGQLDELRDSPNRRSKHDVDAYVAHDDSDAELEPSRARARIQPPAHQHEEQAPAAGQHVNALASHSSVAGKETACDHSSVSSSKHADDAHGKRLQSSAPGPRKAEQVEGEGVEGQEEAEKEEALSAVATSQIPPNSSEIASSAELAPHQTEGPSRGVCLQSVALNSTTESCQSLTTAEGLCLLENAPRQKEEAGLKLKGDANPDVEDSLIRRNVSQAGMSSDAHWKRRIRSRFLYDSK